MVSFNNSLLAKWKWRCLTDSNAIWYELLSFKYGNLSEAISCGTSFSSFYSVWWRDLLLLDPIWFSSTVRLQLKVGNKVRFWIDSWCGTTPLKEVFPRLFQVAANPSVLVGDSGSWAANCWVWGWR